MKIKKRFYCTNCKQFLDRRRVMYDEYEDRYYCRWCENRVMRTGKILEAMIVDYIGYILAHDEQEDFE